jgi:hypothetical protein
MPVMRKISTILGITAFAAVSLSPPPLAAFGIHLGPFYFHVPFVGHHHHPHRLQMRANEARTKPNDVSRSARGRYARTEQSDREALGETNTAALESCTGLAPGVTNLPIDKIRHYVQPTTDQEAALDDLSASSSRASDLIKSSCPSSVPLTPIGRLDAAEQRLDATIKAVQVVRSPLERFYQALSDEQRQRFNATNSSSEGLCSQGAGSFLDVPAQRIEQVVQVTAQQQSAFDDLKKATQKAGDQLQSSCSTAVPKSPVERLDMIERRLTAMVDAIKSVRPNLQNFYASLNDEQKAKFNTMGPPPKATSSRRQSGGQ